jgi:hypothetical protein
MEWKEYVAWFAPISITMVAYVFIKYESDLPRHRPVRDAVFAFAAGRVPFRGPRSGFGRHDQ